MEKNVAVIGAGSSGLTSIKTCKEEGLKVVCYELTNYVGGLWKYREDVVEGLASVMKSTVINSSKELSAFSDFPPPEDFPNYMHNTMFLRYLEMYAEKFDLIPHIKFQHQVISVEPSDDYDESGKWLITVKDLVKDEILSVKYDAVMAATGHHAYPLRPTFPGENTFTGTIIHSHNYRTPKGFEDKNVLVIGVGNSGIDVAVELSTISRKVYLSTRSGCWVLNRVGENGKPFDLIYMSRFWNFIFHIIPYQLSCWIAETTVNKIFDHKLYQLKPKHRIHGQHLAISDALPNKIITGSVVVKGPIKKFVQDSVVFEGEDSVTELDAVILATGYEVKFPYISQKVLTFKNCRPELYKFVFPPHLKHPTLGIIGLIQPTGPLFPIFEIQARWFLRVIKNKVSLPSTEAMYQDIIETQEIISKRYLSGTRHTIEVDFVDYLDDIASKIGVKPNLLKMFFQNPLLFWICFTGPNLPYQYRLQGPHTWTGARDAILNSEKRIVAALQTRADVSKKHPTLGKASMAIVKKGYAKSVIPILKKMLNFARK